ncbi:hypothetical protein PP707_05350, partial [Acetobacter pasteurianus]|nr:hypothetical protein [Acetobacter pasteurianus]
QQQAHYLQASTIGGVGSAMSSRVPPHSHLHHHHHLHLQLFLQQLPYNQKGGMRPPSQHPMYQLGMPLLQPPTLANSSSAGSGSGSGSGGGSGGAPSSPLQQMMATSPSNQTAVSIGGGVPQSNNTYSTIGGNGSVGGDRVAGFSPGVVPTPSTTPMERNSYYFSQYPLFATDWVSVNGTECIALGSYKEGFTNKLEIVYGYEQNDNIYSATTPVLDNYASAGYYDDADLHRHNPNGTSSGDNGFLFRKVADVNLEYPITHLQWDPSMLGDNGIGKQGGGSDGFSATRLAASSDLLRLYKVNESSNDNFQIIQTHTLSNNTVSAAAAGTGAGTNGQTLGGKDAVNTGPPVTSFDWNKTDTNILITSSVDTTCTVWDLNRSHPYDELTDSAVIKTQLIAHDSEVFDVKFIHKSTNVFASVGNDGSMRVFDLRSLEHSTIIYEPIATPVSSHNKPASITGNAGLSSSFPGQLHLANYNSKALLSLATSNIDQHHIATIGVNSNQIIIIDMRMPGLPMAIIDASPTMHRGGSFQTQRSAFGGAGASAGASGYGGPAVNSIAWHPTSNYLLSGGDDCQALVWDINNLHLGGSTSASASASASASSSSSLNNANPSNSANGGSSGNGSAGSGLGSKVIDTPVLAYEEDLEVNNVCWRQNAGDYMGVVSGKGFQAVLI